MTHYKQPSQASLLRCFLRTGLYGSLLLTNVVVGDLEVKCERFELSPFDWVILVLAARAEPNSFERLPETHCFELRVSVRLR